MKCNPALFIMNTYTQTNNDTYTQTNTASYTQTNKQYTVLHAHSLTIQNTLEQTIKCCILTNTNNFLTNQHAI